MIVEEGELLSVLWLQLGGMMSPLTINSELGVDSNLHDMSSLASQCSKVHLKKTQ